MKNKYGESYKGWFVNGVPDKVKKKVLEEARLKDDYDANNYHKLLQLVDLMEIASWNWDLFSSTLSIENKENVGKEKALKWIREFKDIRNKYSHNQAVSDQDIERLNDIRNKFNEKMKF